MRKNEKLIVEILCLKNFIFIFFFFLFYLHLTSIFDQQTNSFIQFCKFSFQYVILSDFDLQFLFQVLDFYIFNKNKNNSIFV